MSSSKDEDLCIAERDFNKTKEMHIKVDPIVYRYHINCIS